MNATSMDMITTPTPQELVSRARALAQKWIRQVCLWIETHDATLEAQDRDLWLALLGVLGGFDTTLEGVLQSTPADGDMPAQRKIEIIEEQLILVCSDIQQQMSLYRSA